MTDLPECPTHAVCPNCREGWGHWNGERYEMTQESAAALGFSPAEAARVAAFDAAEEPPEIAKIKRVADALAAAATEQQWFSGHDLTVLADAAIKALDEP